MDFDLDKFSRMIIALKPEYVWIGFDSHPKCVIYPEPTLSKVESLIKRIEKAGIKVKLKNMDR